MINNQKILAVVPARGGSKGIIKKNMRFLNGKPLITYIINSAKLSKYIDKLIISSDDEDILELGQQMGLDIPFRRPPELASDDTPLIAVIIHAYNYFQAKNDPYEAVLSLQPTCPFLSPASIDKCVELWAECGCDSVVSVSEITRGHPYIAKALLPENRIENFLPIPAGAVIAPRQKRRKAYYLTGGLYLRGQHFLETTEREGHALGFNARAIVVDEIEAVDINSELDLRFADFLVSAGCHKNEDTTL